MIHDLTGTADGTARLKPLFDEVSAQVKNGVYTINATSETQLQVKVDGKRQDRKTRRTLISALPDAPGNIRNIFLETVYSQLPGQDIKATDDLTVELGNGDGFTFHSNNLEDKNRTPEIRAVSFLGDFHVWRNNEIDMDEAAERREAILSEARKAADEIKDKILKSRAVQEEQPISAFRQRIAVR